MNLSMSAALTVALVAVPAVAAAQAERIPDVVQSGQRVLIVDDQGRRIQGRVELASAGALRLSTRGGSEDVALDRIVRIDKPDGLRNGALIGLGAGLVTGAVGATLMHGEGADANQVAAGVFWNALAWTLVGTSIDALFDNRQTLYERGRRLQTRVAPVVGSGVRGAVIAVTW